MDRKICFNTFWQKERITSCNIFIPFFSFMNVSRRNSHFRRRLKMKLKYFIYLLLLQISLHSNKKIFITVASFTHVAYIDLRNNIKIKTFVYDFIFSDAHDDLTSPQLLKELSPLLSCSRATSVPQFYLFVFEGFITFSSLKNYLLRQLIYKSIAVFLLSYW